MLIGHNTEENLTKYIHSELPGNLPGFEKVEDHQILQRSTLPSSSGGVCCKTKSIGGDLSG